MKTFATVGGMLGGLAAAVAMAGACLAAGPLGWLCAFWLVPLAFAAGVALGAAAFMLMLAAAVVTLAVGLYQGLGTLSAAGIVHALGALSLAQGLLLIGGAYAAFWLVRYGIRANRPSAEYAAWHGATYGRRR